MLSAMKKQFENRSERTSRRSSRLSTPLETSYLDESSSSFSDDSDSDRRRRNRRKAVTRRKPVKDNSTADKARKPAAKKEEAGKPSRGPKKKVELGSKIVIKGETKKKESPNTSPDEIIKIAKQDGSTKFQQMRKFLLKANEREGPPDILAEFFATRKERSPTRSSVGSSGSVEWDDFHTGLTPKSSSRRWPSPKVISRESEDGFAASDLLSSDGASVERRLGAFLHSQRSLKLRSKSKALGAGDNVHLTALLVDHIPDLEEKIQTVSKAELRKRILENTAEDDCEKENVSSLDDSLIEAELDMLTGI
jgi:hypothetical protein